MATANQRSMTASALDLGLNPNPTDLPTNLEGETEEQRKKRLAALSRDPMSIISPAVAELLGTGAYRG